MKKKFFLLFQSILLSKLRCRKLAKKRQRTWLWSPKKFLGTISGSFRFTRSCKRSIETNFNDDHPSWLLFKKNPQGCEKPSKKYDLECIVNRSNTLANCGKKQKISFDYRSKIVCCTKLLALWIHYKLLWRYCSGNW